MNYLIFRGHLLKGRVHASHRIARVKHFIALLDGSYHLGTSHVSPDIGLLKTQNLFKYFCAYVFSWHAFQ